MGPRPACRGPKPQAGARSRVYCRGERAACRGPKQGMGVCTRLMVFGLDRGSAVCKSERVGPWHENRDGTDGDGCTVGARCTYGGDNAAYDADNSGDSGDDTS